MADFLKIIVLFAKTYKKCNVFLTPIIFYKSPNFENECVEDMTTKPQLLHRQNMMLYGNYMLLSDT
jgi:hypothetical protein